MIKASRQEEIDETPPPKQNIKDHAQTSITGAPVNPILCAMSERNLHDM